MEQYRNIVIKALKAAPDGSTPEQQADMILVYIGIAQDLAGIPSDIGRRDIDIPILGGAIKSNSLTATQAQTAGNWNTVFLNQYENRGEGVLAGIVNSPEGAPPFTRRISGPSPDQKNYDMEQLSFMANTEAPPSLSVDLGDGKPPIMLNRKIVPREFTVGGKSNGEGVVQVYYSMGGEEGCPSFQIGTGDVAVSIGKNLEDISKAARLRYTREQRKVEPRKTPPPFASMNEVDIDRIMAGSPGGDADDGQAGGRNGTIDTNRAVEYFHSNMTPEEIQFRRG